MRLLQMIWRMSDVSLIQQHLCQCEVKQLLSPVYTSHSHGQRSSGAPHCAVHGLHSTTLQSRLQHTASLIYGHQWFPACVWQSGKALGHILGLPLHDAAWRLNSSESSQTLATTASTREKSVNMFPAKCTLCMPLIWINVNISTFIPPGRSCRDHPSPSGKWSKRPVLSK